MSQIYQFSNESKAPENPLQNESFPAIPNLSFNNAADAVTQMDVEQSTSGSNFNAALKMWRTQEQVSQESESKDKDTEPELTTAQKRKLRKKLNAKRKKQQAALKESSAMNPIGGSTPITGAPKQNIRKQMQNPAKRKNSDPNTSVDTAAKRPDQKATPRLQKNASDIVKEALLTMAIVHYKDKIIIPITKEQYQLIFTAINEIMFDSLDNNFMPTFDGMSIKRDVVRVVCSCSGSASWLESIGALLSLKTKMPLLICTFGKIPWPRKFLAFFPYTKESNDRILRMLNLCNRNLPDIVWEVVRRKESDGGIHLLVKVDEDTAGTLRGNHDNLHFGAGKAKFREFIPKRKAKSKSNEEKEEDGHTSAAEEELDAMANLSFKETVEPITEHNAPKAVGGPEKSSVSTSLADNSIELLESERQIEPQDTAEKQVEPDGSDGV